MTVTLSAATQLLPEAVRRRVTELAAAVLGELAPADVPPALVRVRAFAPVRRARTGAGPLAVALDRDVAFRRQVAAAWREQNAELAAVIDAAELPAATDPRLALAGVYLLRPEGWESTVATLVAELERVEQDAAVRESDAALRARLAAAEEETLRLSARLAAAQEQVAALEEELAVARREARKLRSDADRARSQAREALATAEADRAALERQAAEHAEGARRAAEQVRQATERVEQSRRAEREGRSLADSRLRLLLDTVVEAATGLRRELALPPTDLRPADLAGPAAAAGGAVAGAGAVPAAPAGKGRPPQDPGWLTQLLGMPQVHLIVDGYNVTKTGYGALPLADQRRRLVDGLTALAARTGAEVTCCFDGAEVDVSGRWLRRGVRVLFSSPGTTADELVRRLVRAEPQGRPVVVVSTDGEVVSGVRAAGAHAVPAEALLRLLSRG